MKKWIIIFVTLLLISILVEASILSVDAKHKYRKPKKWKHMGLVYNDVAQIESGTRAETNSGVLVDDPEAILNFTLTKEQVVFVFYQTTAGYGALSGYQIGIQVDGADLARGSTSATYDGWRDTSCVWAGLLAAGPHTIKGRFCCNQPTHGPANIGFRRLLALIFDGVAADFSFTRSLIAVNSGAPHNVLQDDTQAIINLNLPAAQKALVIYNAFNLRGTAQDNLGKNVAISVDDADDLEQGSINANAISGGNIESDGSLVAGIYTLAAGAHIIKGRFRNTFNNAQVTIDERQLLILLFATSLETNFVSAEGEVTTSNTNYDDDPFAMVSRTISASRAVFALYCLGKSHGVTCAPGWCMYKIAIRVDSVDYGVSRRDNVDISLGVDLGETVSTTAIAPLLIAPAGSHDVKGRLGVGASTAKLSRHHLCVLWFPLPGEPTPPPEAFRRQEERQETNRDPPYGFTRLRVLHRVTRIVPWVV